MSTEFHIEKSFDRPDVAVFRVSGRLDAKNAKDLMDACQQAKNAGRTRVVINLAGVAFVASSGIGTLLALTDEFREAGGGVHLVALSESVKSVVDLLNLGQFLNVTSSEADAYGAIGA
ncbi:MAG: STAS domain-containing protein [Gemmatimonadetes bacterium]|nr:STAS domain-containing protein [Gemmatimonadota bacterium]